MTFYFLISIFDACASNKNNKTSVRAEVFRRIKELSKTTVNSRHWIFENDIGGAFSFSKESVLLSLTELESTSVFYGL